MFAFLGALIITNPVSKPDLMPQASVCRSSVRFSVVYATTRISSRCISYVLDRRSRSASRPADGGGAGGPTPRRVDRAAPLAAIGWAFSVSCETRPGFGGIHWWCCSAFSAMLAYAAYIIITRILSYSDSATRRCSIRTSSGSRDKPRGAVRVDHAAELHIVFLMVFHGVCGSVGHYLLILAYRYATDLGGSAFITPRSSGDSGRSSRSAICPTAGRLRAPRSSSCPVSI